MPLLPGAAHAPTGATVRGVSPPQVRQAAHGVSGQSVGAVGGQEASGGVCAAFWARLRAAARAAASVAFWAFLALLAAFFAVLIFPRAAACLLTIPIG